MSSALLVQQSNLRGGLWEGERLWLSLRRLGLSGMLGDEGTIATGMAGAESVKVRDLWLQHMALMPDLISERPGVSVRAVPGLAGLEYLGGDNIIGHASWVFAPVVKLLRRNGYSGRSLQGATYDWRVPPWELERRDQYFSRTMQAIERLREANGGRPVVLLCHSMGALVGHYLCGFAQQARGRAWLDSHVDSLVMVGAPLLGAPSALTAFLVGTRMGLPAAFLNDQAALLMGRSLGSSVWLMPLAGSGGSSMRSVLGDGDGRAFRPGTSFLRLHSELHVAARLADVSELWRRSAGGGSLGKMCVRVSFGGSSFLSRPFDASPGRVPLFADLPESGGEDSNRREFNMVFPAALGLCDQHAAALDPACTSADWLVVEVVEPRVALRRGMRRLLKVSTVSGSLLPGVLQSAARRGYDQTLGQVEKRLSWRVICAARVQVKDLLSAEQLERDLPQRAVGPVPVRVELRAPRLDGLFGQARAEVELALTLTSHSALHLARGVPARREAGLLSAQLPSQQLLKKLSFFQYNDRSASDSEASGPVPDIMGAGGSTGGSLQLPFLSRLDKPEPRTIHVAYCPMDLLRMAKLDNVCELLARYEADPLINSNAPPVRRVVAVFGVNVPTQLGTVMRRSARLTSTGRLEKDFELDDSVTISRRWATQQALSIRHGVLLETRNSRHLCAATRRIVKASGDGTVPYESLTHVHRWASSELDVSVHELEGVEHRGILKNKAFHKVLLDHLFEGIEAHSLSGVNSTGASLGGGTSFSRLLQRMRASELKIVTGPRSSPFEPGAVRHSGRTTFVKNAARDDHDNEDGEALLEGEEEAEAAAQTANSTLVI
jgi:pimeloyl-ACP methyl ester carboxylesterase